MRPATIAVYDAAQDAASRAICERLRHAIDTALPDTNGKIWHAHPVWFLNGNPVVGYSRLKTGVRLLFWSGRSFETPGLSPEGSFQAAEARFTAADQVDEPLLARWLAEARTIQWDYQNLAKRRGRLERLT